MLAWHELDEGKVGLILVKEGNLGGRGASGAKRDLRTRGIIE